MSNNSEDKWFQHDSAPRIGILCVNLGTPDNPDASSLRRYLKQFLWDPRVVDYPRLLWWVLLRVILLIRPGRSAQAYKKVWTEQGSPLMVHSINQVKALQKRFRSEYGDRVQVVLAMRYGNPSINEALLQLQQSNVHRLLVLPLYPQYSSSTTASTFDAVAHALARTRWIPELRFINQYHDEPAYIQALVNSVHEAWEKRDKPQKLLISFHGTPKRFLLSGDPYFCQCHATARLLADRLALKDSEWMISFQSIFGREEWLQPYTIETLKELAQQNIQSVDIICPGFSADCLETLEEIEEENRHAFLQAGGKHFHYISALNDRDDHIDALYQLATDHARYWLDKPDLPADELKNRLTRAKRLGAQQ